MSITKQYHKVVGLPLSLRIYNGFIRGEVLTNLHLQKLKTQAQFPLLDFLIKFADKYTEGDIKQAENLLKNPLISQHLDASIQLSKLQKEFEESEIEFETKSLISMLECRTQIEHVQAVCDFLDIPYCEWDHLLQCIPNESYLDLLNFYVSESNGNGDKIEEITSPK